MNQAVWYAVYTRSRHEKQVAALLRQQRIETFLPLRRTRSIRTDRRVTVEIPALPGYVFVRCVLSPEQRALIKRASGVLWLVESAGRPAVIPERQVQSLRSALENGLDAEGHPVLTAGDRVRVVSGPLRGAEGYLVRLADNRRRLVMMIDYVNQALSVDVDAACVEAVN